LLIQTAGDEWARKRLKLASKASRWLFDLIRALEAYSANDLPDDEPPKALPSPYRM
jgi:hypothetical protein